MEIASCRQMLFSNSCDVFLRGKLKLMMKALTFLPIVIGSIGFKATSMPTPSFEDLYRCEFGIPCPGVASVSSIYCDVDKREENLVEFADGRFVVAGERQYHVGREVLLSGGNVRFNPISGTLWHPESERFNTTQGISPLTTATPRAILGDPGLSIESEKFMFGDRVKHLDAVFPGWEEYGGRRVPVRIIESQSDLSVYERDGKTEFNCGLVAAYTTMNYLINDSTEHRKAFSSFPLREHERLFMPETDEKATYKEAATWNYVPKRETFIFEKAYISMRERALQIAPDFVFRYGLNSGQVSGVMEWFAHDYGLDSFDAYEVFHYNSEVSSDRFTQHFESGKPMPFGYLSATRKAHVITIIGFMHYKRIVKEWWWEKTEWRTILEAYDNAHIGFDITQFQIGAGSGCFNEYFW